MSYHAVGDASMGATALGAKLSDQSGICDNAFNWGIITAKGRARCHEMSQTDPPRDGLPAFLWDLQRTATQAKAGDPSGQFNFKQWYRMGMITAQFYTSIMGQRPGTSYRAVLRGLEE